MEHGLAFCAAVMGTDLRHTPVVGGEEGYPDLIAYPDLSTMTLVPWEPGLAWCIADLRSAGEHALPADPRGAVRRAVAGFEEIGLAPVVGPELEFFLCERDPESPNGVRHLAETPPALGRRDQALAQLEAHRRLRRPHVARRPAAAGLQDHAGADRVVGQPIDQDERPGR